MNHVYFIVEGPHDIAAIGRILKENSFKIVKYETELDSYWKRMVPKNYPINGDLLKRPPHPTFYQREDCSIAIHSSGSNTELVNILSANLSNLDFSELKGIGLFVDADDKTPNNCCQRLLKDISNNRILEDNIKQLFIEILPGEVRTINPCKSGIYVFPDNENMGTLENVLLSCAECSYNDLLNAAKQYTDSVNSSYKDKYWSRSSQNKVLVGCIANVLKPGSANQVSIEKDDWLCKKNIHIESVAMFHNFIISFIS